MPGARGRHEAPHCLDPVHLMRVFGIEAATAMRYVNAAHPRSGRSHPDSGSAEPKLLNAFEPTSPREFPVSHGQESANPRAFWPCRSPRCRSAGSRFSPVSPVPRKKDWNYGGFVVSAFSSAPAFVSWDATSRGWTVAGGTCHLMLGEGSREVRIRADVALPHEAMVR